MYALDFFHFLYLEQLTKHWHSCTIFMSFWQRDLLQILILYFNVLWRYPLLDSGFSLWASYAFRELFSCQISGNSNERFLRKQFISTKTTSRNFLVKCACVVFGFHGKDEKHAKGLGECFFCSERKEKKSRNKKLSYLGSKLSFIIHFMWNWGITLSNAVFAYHNPSVRL